MTTREPGARGPLAILLLASEPVTAPTDREMLPSERRAFVRSHRTCVFGTPRLHDGPALSVVYYVPTDDDELLVSTMAGRGKARAVGRDGKVSLCVLDERWPFAYVQVYADATVDRDPDLVVDVMMAVAGRMSGEPLGDDARPFVRRWPPRRIASSSGAVRTRRSPNRPATFTATTRKNSSRTGSPRPWRGTPPIPHDAAGPSRRPAPHRGVALVTGSSSGIGAAMARALAARVSTPIAAPI